MHKKLALSATLIMLILASLIAPAATQDPPPRTPSPQTGLVVGNTDLTMSMVDKMPQAIKFISTPSSSIISGSPSRDMPPVPGRMIQNQADRETALVAMERFLHKQSDLNGPNQPTLLQVVLDGEAAYGILSWPVREIEDLFYLVGRRTADGNWQISLLPVTAYVPVSLEESSPVLPWPESENLPSPFSTLPVTATLEGSAGSTLLNGTLGFSIRYPHDWQVHMGNSHAPSLPHDTLTFSSSPGVFDVTVVALKLSEVAQTNIQDFAKAVVMKFLGEVDDWTYLPSKLPYQSSVRAVYTQPSYGYESVVFVADFLIIGERGYWIFTQFASNDNSFVPIYESGQQRLAVFQTMVSTFVALASPSGKPESTLSIADIERLTESSQKSASPSATSASFMWPTTGYIGYIYNQPTSGGALHNGIDFWTSTKCDNNGNSRGNPVYPPHAGQITMVYATADGIQDGIRIKHSDLENVWTHYWHLADYDTRDSHISSGIRLWDQVTTETLLGYQGTLMRSDSHGNSIQKTCVHLHLTVANGDRDAAHIDPTFFFGVRLDWSKPGHVGWHHYVEHQGGSACPAPTDGHPRDGETVVASDRRVRFSWTAPSCSGLDYYTFRVADHQDIDNGPWIIDHGVGSGETSVTEQIPSQYDNQTLYWAIWPHNSTGYGVRGGPWSFKVNPNQGSGDTVTIYSEAGYRGDKYGWHDPCTSPECGNLPDWLNTRASSIKIAPGWSVRVYESDGQTGGQKCYNDSDSDFSGDTFDNGHPVNDHVRSVAIYHQEQCPAPPSPPQPPAQPFFPTNGSSHPAGTSFLLNWQPSANATAYQVHLEGGPGISRDSDWISAHLWNVGTLPSGNYKWKVRARNQYGTSAYGAEWTFTVQEGAPNAPSNLTASAISPSQINLTWSDNSSNETGFRLYREGLLVATLGAGTTEYQDTGLECGRGYNYYVVAYNDAGESGHSNTASATTHACPSTTPPAPNPVSPAQNAWFGCGDEITLVWDDLGDGVEYYVEIQGANNRTSGWITSNSWYLGEQDGTRTWWHVKARYVGETDDSGWSSTTWFNVSDCPQYPDLHPYAPAGYQYPVVPSMVQGTHEESTLYVDQPTYFDWHFINDGNETATDDFYVELWVDGDQILRYPYSNMDTGGIWGVDDGARAVVTPGWHTVRLVTDPDGSVDESDESNNEWTRSFYWHVPCNDEDEPNDEPGQAYYLSYGDTATGVDICPLGDWDYYTFYGEAGETIIADVDAQVLGSNLDSMLVLYDSDGTTELTSNDDDGTSLDSRIVYALSHDGYYYLRVREYNDGGVAGGDYFYNLSLAGAESAPYYNEFEADTSGWEADGMWHVVDDSSPYPNSHSGTHSWWYGQDATGDYDTGASNSGSLTSPPIYIPDTGYYLRFNYWYETETQGTDYDRRCVQVSSDNAPFVELYCLSDDGTGWWHSSPAIDLSDFAGQIIRIQFNFDTVDELYNGFRGWYVDDFKISNTPPPSCSDVNEPNDTPEEATVITYGAKKSGYICPGGDVDYFVFNGNAGDTIVAGIDADSLGSSLDSVLVLLADDGVTELASNDDAVSGGGSHDSRLGYTLPYTGTYYLKVREYGHPSYGDSNYHYDLYLLLDNTPPTGALLSPTTGDYISSTRHISITVEASDPGGVVRNVTFFWHPGDWSDPDWKVLGEDWDGSDGWAMDWDVGSLPDQTNAALYAWAFDWGGNWVGMECWDLTLDRESPTTEMETFAPYGGASFLDFWLVWYGEDATSGAAGYDIQYKDGADGAWTDLITNTTDVFTRLVGQDGHTYYFRSRARDQAGNVGEYPATAQISYTVQVCPTDMDEWEIDDTPASANLINTDGTPQARSFDMAGDQDWVKFNAVAGQKYVLQTENVGGYADTVLYLYDTDGTTLLEYNDDFEGLNWASRIEWTAPADGTYYALVTHWDKYAYGCETKYTLSVERQQHKVFLPLILRSH